MFSKKATKIDDIFTVNLTLCSEYQINGEDFVNFCGLLRKHQLYPKKAKADSQAFRSAEVRMSTKEFSHGLDSAQHTIFSKRCIQTIHKSRLF